MPGTPIEQLHAWCVENILWRPVTGPMAEERLLAMVRSQARALGAMCSPMFADVPIPDPKPSEVGRTMRGLILNPWAEQPLLWEGSSD